MRQRFYVSTEGTGIRPVLPTSLTEVCNRHSVLGSVIELKDGLVAACLF